MGRDSDLSHVGLMQCFYCGEEFGVAIDKHLRDTLPRGPAVFSLDPCPKCREVLDSGGIIIIGTSTQQAEIERQRLEAKKVYDSWSPVRQKARGFNFVPDIYRLGMLAIAPGEPAEKWSKMFQGKVKPGEWTFIGEEGWKLICEPLIDKDE